VSIARTIPLILVSFAPACTRDAAPTTPKVATAHTPSTRSAPRVPSQPIQQPASRPPGEPFTLALDPGADAPAPVTEAVAVITPTKGHHAKGTVRFREVSGGLEVVTTIDNLPGTHAYHVHVYGDCSSPDAASAGPHFHFTGSSLHPREAIITGNLGELRDEGRITSTHQTRVDAATLHGPFSIVGRSVVIHAKPNDPKITPDGSAGKRIGCGVIGIANPERATPKVAQP
jgi:Cu-Zn family superoxide dismutase